MPRCKVAVPAAADAAAPDRSPADTCSGTHEKLLARVVNSGLAFNSGRIARAQALCPACSHVIETRSQPLVKRSGALPRIALRIAVVLAIAMLVSMLMDWSVQITGALPAEQGAQIRFAVLAAALLIYIVLMATPFVPGIEIGLALLMIRGAEIAPIVYLATVLGLMLAYCIGCRLPIGPMTRFFEDFRLKRAANLVQTVAPLGPDERLALLEARLPIWARGRAMTLRYPLFGLLLNLPGNAFIGGGGGLALLAGLSGLFKPLPTLLTIALAVAPLPFVLWLWGYAGSIDWLPLPH